jgi:hypothetical protein
MSVLLPVVLDPGWGDIEPNVVAVDTSCSALVSQALVDPGNALAFIAACDEFADGSDVHVFEVAEEASGFEQFEVGGDEFINEGCREVVERESGDNEIKRGFGLIILDGDLVDRGDRFGLDPAGFRIEALVENVDEVGIEFDEVKLIVGLEELDDTVGDGSGAGANFEDTGGLLRVSAGKKASHRMSEEAAAGGDGAGSLESFAELREEREVVLESAGHLPSSVKGNRLR